MRHAPDNRLYMVSLHSVPQWDVLIGGAGVALGGETWRLEAAAEAVRQGDDLVWNAKAQVVKPIGETTVGGGVYKPEANGQPIGIEGFISYEGLEGLDLTTLVRARPKGDWLLAFGADFSLTRAVYVRLGVATAQGADVAVETGLWYAF